MFRRRDFACKPPRRGLRVRFSIRASGWQASSRTESDVQKTPSLASRSWVTVSVLLGILLGNSTFFRRSRQPQTRIVHLTLYPSIYSLIYNHFIQLSKINFFSWKVTLKMWLKVQNFSKTQVPLNNLQINKNIPYAQTRTFLFLFIILYFYSFFYSYFYFVYISIPFVTYHKFFIVRKIFYE